MKIWNIEAETGYKPKTTFWQDFSIADGFGADAVLDTYRRSMQSWKTDAVYLTELVMVLNWKCWQHHGEGNEKLSALYSELYYEAREYALENLKEDNLLYFLETTD